MHSPAKREGVGLDRSSWCPTAIASITTPAGYSAPECSSGPPAAPPWPSGWDPGPRWVRSKMDWRTWWARWRECWCSRAARKLRRPRYAAQYFLATGLDDSDERRTFPFERVDRLDQADPAPVHLNRRRKGSLQISRAGTGANRVLESATDRAGHARPADTVHRPVCALDRQGAHRIAPGDLEQFLTCCLPKASRIRPDREAFFCEMSGSGRH